MNTWSKAIAVTAAAAVIGFGGITTANAATNDEIATYLTSAVGTQLGLTDTTSLHTIIVEAMNNGLIQTTVTDAAASVVDGTQTLTPEELAALFDANLTQQLGSIEQQLINLGVLPDPNATLPPVDPTLPPVDNDGDDDADENDDMDDDADEAEHDGDHTPSVVFRNQNNPQGDGAGHTSTGDGLGLGHTHHDDEND